GTEAKKGDTVEVHYTGWLKNGTKFDSSKDRDEAFSFKLGAGRVIKGWDEGVQGMKVGGKRKLIIPASLAYGAREIKDPNTGKVIIRPAPDVRSGGGWQKVRCPDCGRPPLCGGLLSHPPRARATPCVVTEYLASMFAFSQRGSRAGSLR